MSSIVQVKGLSKKFGQVLAVNNISFNVESTDVYGFLGQNGAGKSTTIRMLLTLIAATEGEIEIFGLNLQTNRNEILRQIGAVIERPDLYKYLSAYENLQLFATMSGVHPTRKLLMDQLDMVGLSGRADSKVRTYSQGMKQRLGIAIALVHDPQLIILDEPTNGLDPQGIADIRNLILHLSRHMKKTVIVSSHLLSEVEQIANRMIIIDKGKKVAEGEVAHLLDPKNTLVSIKTGNNIAARQLLLSSPWGKLVKPGEDASPVLVQMHRDQIPALNQLLVQSGVDVFALSSENSLEAYFLSLTGNNQHVPTFEN